jgi:pyridoxamine 5'-phosphate oxidase
MLPEFDAPPEDPIALFDRWLELAELRGVSEPFAFVLSTVDDGGRPSSRVVLLKGVSPSGLIFGTSMFSRKGQEMTENAWVSAAFHWRETTQQVRLTGRVTPLDERHSDSVFAERPRGAQAAATVSRQSTMLFDEAELRRQAEHLVKAGEAIPRPFGWRAYEIKVQNVEFWHGRVDRLHRRLEYERGESRWSHRRLQP